MTFVRMSMLAVLASLCALAGISPAAASCSPAAIAEARGCAASADLATRVDRVVRAAMKKHRLKAVLAGIAIDGEPQLVDAWGDSMTGVAARPDMHFRNGAVAIAYLGAVLLQLDQAGVLSVDDKLAKWFPHYPNAERVTLAMLIRGTSGYADYVTDKTFLKASSADPFRAWRPDELIDIGLSRQRVCAPGTCWSYAHTNFVILGKVIEAASGRPLERIIRSGVIDRLGLEDTRSDMTARIQRPALHAFSAERGLYEETTYWNPSWTLARGAVMTSNIPDLLASAAAIGEGSLVSKASRQRLFDPATARFAPWNARRYYAWGFFMINGWTVQNPSFGGYAATMAYLPKRRLAIAASVTVEEGAADGNLSTALVVELAALLAPEFPLQ